MEANCSNQNDCFAVGASQEIGKNFKFFVCLLYFAGA
jgi:hypothetical protein